MLAQIYRVTPSMAEEISKQPGFRTLRETFETYSDPGLTERQKEELLVGTWVGYSLWTRIRVELLTRLCRWVERSQEI